MKKAFLLAVALLSCVGSVQAAPFDKQQVQEVKSLVRKTLLENPEILLETAEELKKKGQASRASAEKHMLKAREAELFENGDSPVIGNPKAKLSIVLFSDYNCNFCKRQDSVLRQIVAENPKVKIIVKELPILSNESIEAAKYALAVYYQNKGKYQAVNARLMSKKGSHSKAAIKASLEAEGVNVKDLKIDERVERQIIDNSKLAADLGIPGTPTLVFSDKILKNFTSEDDLKVLIKERL